MKIIKLKKEGKTFHQFVIYDATLNIAKKLGISEEQYIVERSKVELEERRKNNASVVI